MVPTTHILILLLVVTAFACSGAAAESSAAAAGRQLKEKHNSHSTAAASQRRPNAQTYAVLQIDVSLIDQGQQARNAAVGLSVAQSTAGAQQVLNKPTHPSPSAGPLHLVNPQTDASPNVKPLWPPDGIDFAVLAIITFSLSLAGGAGIGGGAILVPIYLMLRGWPTAIAVALSYVTILGGSFANFICNVTRHRPNGKRTIDWELILMMEPTTIAGALVGAVANKVLPNWVTTYLLALMLTFMALRLYSKGKQTYAKETKLLQAAKAEAKERRAERNSSVPHTPRLYSSSQLTTSQTLASQPAAVAVPEHRHLPHYTDALTRSFSRSFSRLRGSLLVGGFEPGTLTSPRPEVLSWQHQTADDIAAAADVGGGAGCTSDQAVHIPSQQAIQGYLGSTLFQGDGLDGFEPVVVLPHSDDLSTTDSADDLEEGVPEILQPLLSQDGPTSPADVQRSDQDAHQDGAGAGSRERHKPRDVISRQESPDLTLHLGSAAEVTPKPPEREPSLPLPHFLTLLGLSAWVVAADIAQDSFTCGSWQYWMSQVSVLVPVLTILAVFRQVLLRKYRHDDLPAGHQLPDGELHWTSRTTVLYPLMCSTAGLIAGLFGIGGGVVKGPLMLELGVPADVAAATSATMIMFTAGSACLVYSRFGQILYDYACVLLVLGFLVTLCSQLLTFLLVKLLGRRSVIVFMMVALMAAATGIMYVQSGLVTADLVRHPEDAWHFGSICPGQGSALKRLGSTLAAKLQLGY